MKRERRIRHDRGWGPDRPGPRVAPPARRATSLVAAVALGPAICLGLGLALGVGGCEDQAPRPYGMEQGISSPLKKRQVWAVAPALNLSGEHAVDPLLQADLVYQQLQQVNGLTIVPVNRVVEVYASLKMEKVQSERQAYLVCDLLGVDGLVVPTVTSYDPYNPPKLGASLQLFIKPADYARQADVSPHDLVRLAAPARHESLPADAGFVQVVGMFDSANGSVRQALNAFATGRNDPVGPYAAREYLVSMDRYCGFVYFVLISDLIHSPRLRRAVG